jgi:aspartyl-tRNA(Asn)/glutamyl-tRNA(Gln) amidotransferase subunit C
MKINDATLDRIAELAKLDYSDPSARAAILVDMERVLSFVEKLNEVDTSGVEPLIFMTEEHDVLREDVIVPSDVVGKREALKNSPVKDSDYFKVPRVVDKG